MVLESVIRPFKAEKKPWEMLIIGFAYSTIAIFLSLFIFPSEASLVAVFLTVLACVPIMFSTIRLEEKKDLVIKNERKLLSAHSRALRFFMFLFIGITLSCVFWYVVLPIETTQNLFSVQSSTISEINVYLHF